MLNNSRAVLYGHRGHHYSYLLPAVSCLPRTRNFTFFYRVQYRLQTPQHIAQRVNGTPRQPTNFFRCLAFARERPTYIAIESPSPSASETREDCTSQLLCSSFYGGRRPPHLTLPGIAQDGPNSDALTDTLHTSRWQ